MTATIILAAPVRKSELISVFAKDPVHWAAFGLGSGLLPWAPGTWGTAVGVLVFLVLPEMPLPVYLVLLAAVFAAGVWICGASARRLGIHDHGCIVFDEIFGMLATLAVVPREWPWIAAAFIAFRVMDIAKPWPIRDMDHGIRGGLGIMLDDWLAAVYAAIILLLLQHFKTMPWPV